MKLSQNGHHAAAKNLLMASLLASSYYATCSDLLISRVSMAPIVSAYSMDDSIIAPELWTFGNGGQPQRTVALRGRGIRSIFDLRVVSVPAAKDMLRQYANLGLQMTITLRWKVQHESGQRLFGPDNYDVPPSPSETAFALDFLDQVLSSDEAKRLGSGLTIQFYNEIAGGPGKFALSDLSGMMDFATTATQLIREKAPQVHICGPALTIGAVNPDLEDDPGRSDQAEIVKKFVEWTAQYADAIDIHLHGTDGTLTRETLSDLHEYLNNIPNGSHLQIDSWEWSPARFPDRDNDEAVRNAMIGIWQAMAEGGVARAAYGAYWSTEERKEGGAGEIYLWTNVADNDGQPHEPIYSTLLDIAAGNITIDQPDDDNDSQNDDTSNQSDEYNNKKLISNGNTISASAKSASSIQWIAGSPDNAENIEQSGAGGVHETIDLRTASSRDMKQTLHAFAKRNLGVALTVRWSDPVNPDDLDSPPSSRDANRMMNRLRATLRSNDAKKIAEQGLWVQFYDEIAGKTGRMPLQDADALLQFATDAVAKIRSSSPYVKIAGPAVTNIELLSNANRSPDEQNQYDLLTRAVDWSVKYADAVNIHIDNTLSYSQASALKQQLRSFIDSRQNGTNFPIVDWNNMPIAVSTALTSTKPAETKAQYNKRRNSFKKDYKNQLKEQYRAAGEKGWQKKWNTDWKSSWESEWEKHESNNSIQ